MGVSQRQRNSEARTNRRIVEAARSDPTTRCWRCGRTLDEHEPHANGDRPTWHAGHTIDGDPLAPRLPEASTCNTSAGAAAGNEARSRDGERSKLDAAKRWRG